MSFTINFSFTSRLYNPVIHIILEFSHENFIVFHVQKSSTVYNSLLLTSDICVTFYCWYIFFCYFHKLDGKTKGDDNSFELRKSDEASGNFNSKEQNSYENRKEDSIRFWHTLDKKCQMSIFFSFNKVADNVHRKGWILIKMTLRSSLTFCSTRLNTKCQNKSILSLYQFFFSILLCTLSKLKPSSFFTSYIVHISITIKITENKK
jgi:hypothetical protein